MLKDIWVVLLVISIVLFVVAVIFIFVWDIPNLIDEISGRKAKRQIKMLHDINANTGTFDKLSTNEIYTGMASGTLLTGNIQYNVSNSSKIDNEEIKTNYLSEHTSVQRVIVLEEQTSL